MRNSPAFRLIAALLGVLFAFNFAQPVWMSGMDMSSMNMSGMDMSGMQMSGSSIDMRSMNGMHHAMIATNKAASADAHSMHEMHTVADQQDTQKSSPKNNEQECKQHECCASALVHAALSPLASLSWLPEHIISRETPESVDCVVDTDVQLRLPFANGPPRNVTV